MVCKGKKEYEERHNGISIVGRSYTDKEIDASAQSIADICFDSSESKRFADYMGSLSETGFSAIKNTPPNIKDWQVGEGFAEAYITAHFSCSFPWTHNRDLKNPNSSLSGADLVGFYQGKFLFGEVKTSTEGRYPPQVTSKKSDGLNTQLNKLCADHDLRSTLIQYLFHRQKNKDEYKSACKAYLESKNNFYIFGVLVRSVQPNVSDWGYLKSRLQTHDGEKVILVALYLPVNNGIKRLHARVLSKKVKP